MSFPVLHMCGEQIEKSTALHPGGGYYAYGEHDGDPMVPITEYPKCREPLCDTDLMYLTGYPLYVRDQTEWSKARRRERGWPEN